MLEEWSRRRGGSGAISFPEKRVGVGGGREERDEAEEGLAFLAEDVDKEGG